MAGEEMKRAEVSKYARGGVGDLEEVLSVASGRPVPTLDGKRHKGMMLVRVLACSLSPGDWRRVNGTLDFISAPKRWPYTPGHDLCGVVMQVLDGCPFKVGDRVAANCQKRDPMCDGLAEVSLVETAAAALVPAGVSDEDACALPTSAQRAWQLVVKAQRVKQQDRVLVLGGAGGIGLFLVQLAKRAGASFVAVTSSSAEGAAAATAAGADRVIDYTAASWWKDQALRQDKLDVVFDCAEGVRSWRNCRSVLKSGRQGGRFCAVTLDDPLMEAHGVCAVLPVLKWLAVRPAMTKLRRSYPRFHPLAVVGNSQDLAAVLALVADGQLRVVHDPPEPLPFTKEGVIDGFRRVADRHAHGKIVIRIAAADA